MLDLDDKEGSEVGGAQAPSFSGALKPKSSHRIHYEAQVEVIRRQIGELESIREKLGLSQRKICQLLMVDPSAWTRWTKRGDEAPPHIYRALQWYMILQEKIPGLTPQYFVGKDPEVLHQKTLRELSTETQKRKEFEEAFSAQTLKLEKQILEVVRANLDLVASKESLEVHVSELKASVRRHRLIFFLLSLGGLILSFPIYGKFLW